MTEVAATASTMMAQLTAVATRNRTRTCIMKTWAAPAVLRAASILVSEGNRVSIKKPSTIETRPATVITATYRPKTASPP